MNKKELQYINKHFDESIEGKTILITGGNSGLGFECAKIFVYLKAKVIIAVRNENRGLSAITEIKKEFTNAQISLMILDQSKEESIKSFANEIINKKIDIDIFYHNAGIYRVPFEIVEGKDIITGTNFYGPLMINSLLIPYFHSLNHEVKMIITSSIAAANTHYGIMDLTPNPKRCKIIRYCNSKLLDAYMFYYLLENDKSNIKYLLVHPGVARTPLFKKVYKNKVFIFFSDIFMKLFANPTWKSALGTLIAIKNDNPNGTFIGPVRFFHFKGYPHKNNFLKKKVKNLNQVMEEAMDICGYKLIDKK